MKKVDIKINGKKYTEIATGDGQFDAFINVTSKHLPFVSNFLQFWNSNIVISEEDEMLEISGIFSLCNSPLRAHMYHFSPLYSSLQWICSTTAPGHI